MARNVRTLDEEAFDAICRVAEPRVANLVRVAIGSPVIARPQPHECELADQRPVPGTVDFVQVLGPLAVGLGCQEQRQALDVPDDIAVGQV